MDFITINNINDTPLLEVYQSVGGREEQEDSYVVCKLDIGLLVAVADGHRGAKTANKVAVSLPVLFQQELDVFFKGHSNARYVGIAHAKMRDILRSTIKKLIELVKEEVSGSTLSVAFIERGTIRKDGRYLPHIRITQGQIGDSIFALSEKPGGLRMAPLHNVAYAPKDVAAIKSLYQQKYNKLCKVDRHYIYSTGGSSDALALTRALGDMPFLLVRKPVIKTYTIRPDDAMLLLASDGVVDNINPYKKTVRSYLKAMREGYSIKEIGEGIKCKHDNVTMIGLRFEKYK